MPSAALGPVVGQCPRCGGDLVYGRFYIGGRGYHGYIDCTRCNFTVRDDDSRWGAAIDQLCRPATAAPSRPTGRALAANIRVWRAGRKAR